MSADLRPREPGATPAAGPRMGPPGAAVGGGARARDVKAALRRLGTLLLAEKYRLAAVVALSLTSVLLGVLGPWLLGKGTDMVVSGLGSAQGIDFAALARLLLLTGALMLVAAGANWWQGWIINGVVQGFSRGLRASAADKLSRVPLAWFDRQPHGEVLSRVTNDIDNVTQSLQQLSSQLLISLFQVLGVLTMMVVLSPLLSLEALAAVALSMAATRRLGSLAQPLFAAQWRWTGVLNARVEESYTGQMLVKAFGHRALAQADFEAANTALRRNAARAQFVSGVIQPVIMFIGNLGYVAVVISGAFAVLAGGLSIGALQAFIQYIRQLNQPMAQVSSMAAVLQSAAASAERVFELLDAPEFSPDADPPAELAATQGRIEFDHVRFRYQSDKPLFEDVSLRVEPGQTVAIVGPTGAGKTTLVNLLMRFYEIDAGAIRLDGIDIRQLRRDELRRHFGMVLQDAWLFSGSIRDNIAYGRPGASDQDILEAARACHVDDFVRTLPQGYDTVMDADGAGLSVGQRQLLTIARAFVARPSVLVLDEATSSVDTHTELLVQRAMARLRQGRTSFVIAHRLSTIRDADLIVYMEKGTVVEQGNHPQLMALKGRYWQLQMANQAPVDQAAQAGPATPAENV